VQCLESIDQKLTASCIYYKLKKKFLNTNRRTDKKKDTLSFH